MTPDVSVVIPTRGRPALLERALRGALGQTHRALEVVVVIDGPDDATRAALAGTPDARVRVVALEASVGGAEARNVGVRAARGAWVALLDDDDEWRPDKIERQLAAARAADVGADVVVGCRLLARRGNAEEVWATRLPAPGERVADYILERRGPFLSAAQVQTSTLLAPRALLRRVPFRRVPRHQEWDWLLRASREPRFAFRMLPETLSVWHVDEGRARVSTHRDAEAYRFSLGWIREHRASVSARAYGDFLLTTATDVARHGRNRRACFALLAEAFRRGRPGPWALLAWSGIVLLPRDARRALRVFARGRA